MRCRTFIASPFRPTVRLDPSAPDNAAIEAYSAELHRNVFYALRCFRNALELGEAAFPPHLLYPLALRDRMPVERERGIEAGSSWLALANILAVYQDYGISAGMKAEIGHAQRFEVSVVYRKIGKNPTNPVDTTDEGDERGQLAAWEAWPHRMDCSIAANLAELFLYREEGSR